jgi:hypothetical protein
VKAIHYITHIWIDIFHPLHSRSQSGWASDGILLNRLNRKVSRRTKLKMKTVPDIVAKQIRMELEQGFELAKDPEQGPFEASHVTVCLFATKQHW